MKQKLCKQQMLEDRKETASSYGG